MNFTYLDLGSLGGRRCCGLRNSEELCNDGHRMRNRRSCLHRRYGHDRKIQSPSALPVPFLGYRCLFFEPLLYKSILSVSLSSTQSHSPQPEGCLNSTLRSIFERSPIASIRKQRPFTATISSLNWTVWSTPWIRSLLVRASFSID